MSVCACEGECPPTWEYDDWSNMCFKYFGGPLPFSRAKKQCESEEALLADVRGKQYMFTKMMIAHQNDYYSYNLFQFNTRAWVYTSRFVLEDCPVIRNFLQETFDCSVPLAYFCSKDPSPIEQSLDALVWILTAIFLLVVLLAVLALFLAYVGKARMRRLERRVRQRGLVTAVRTAQAARSAQTMTVGAGLVVGGGGTVMAGAQSEVGGAFSPYNGGGGESVAGATLASARNQQLHGATLAEVDVLATKDDIGKLGGSRGNLLTPDTNLSAYSPPASDLRLLATTRYRNTICA